MNKHSRIWLTGAALLALAIGTESYTSSVQASPAAQKSSKTAPALPTETYIIRYVEPPLASYDGSAQNLAAIPRTAPTDGPPKLDVHSPEARAYVLHLQTLQNNRITAMRNLLGHSIPVRTQMQHALNAVVVDLSTEDLKRVKRMEGVEAVERDVYRPLATDNGPGFIGASTIWWGARAGQDTMFATSFEDDTSNGGQGIVIGDIDTGYNSASPSFTATDDKGYTVTNPLGAGMYLGQCAVPNIARAGCNSKVIGVYDEIGLTTTPLPSTFTVEDTGGHGSHTASTSAGNSRTATIRDLTTRISGVAPHANLFIYRACDANGCKQSATSSAVNHAVADGVVDVLTYSISGGTDMWEDSTSMAFMNATAAGIAIAAAGATPAPPYLIKFREPSTIWNHGF